MDSFSLEEEVANLQRLRRGGATDREVVFEALFAQLRERVFALCWNVLGNRHDAEDAMQECFLDIHRGLRGFRGEARLSTWVYRLAIHAALRTRRARPAPAMILEDARPLTGEAPTPDVIASARQELKAIGSALERLSLEQRTVLALFALDGLGHEEIAGVLGVPVGTVWSRLHAARCQLRAAIRDGHS